MTSDEALANMRNAAETVTHAAQQLSDNAEELDREYRVEQEDMNELRVALEDFTRAERAYMSAVANK